MKLRLLLIAAISIPMAVRRIYDIRRYIDWTTGYFNADVTEYIIAVLLFLSALLVVPVIKGFCRRRGLSASDPGRNPVSRILLTVLGVLIGFGMKLRLSQPLPTMKAKRVLFVLTLAVQALCALSCFLLAFTKARLSKTRDAWLSSMLPLYLAFELLQRFFAGITNPYNTSLVISFLTLTALVLALLRWAEYRLTPDEPLQRRFLSWAMVAFLLGAGWRLPSLLMVLDPPVLTELTAIATDFICSCLVLSFSMDAVGKEY